MGIEFTKGDWEVGTHGFADYDVPFINIRGKDGFHICKVSSRKENKGNAKLIASAPKMYEVLKALHASKNFWLTATQKEAMMVASVLSSIEK